MKWVINRCFGGFSLSDKAIAWLRERGLPEAKTIPLVAGEADRSGYVYTQTDIDMFRDIHHLYTTERNDPLLVLCVEELGEERTGRRRVWRWSRCRTV